MPTVCNDLRLGGTLSASGISGGTSINSTALYVWDWAGLLGTPGRTGAPLEVNGNPGAFFAGDLLGRPRVFPLNIAVSRSGPAGFGTLVEASAGDQVWANTDTFLDLASTPQTYLEVDLPDGTSRYLKVTNLDPAPAVLQEEHRRFSILLASDWPWWRAGGVESSDTINGTDTLTVAGRKTIYDATLVFAGDGTFTHNDEGWAIQVTGSSNPVTVKLGPPPREVTESGVPALNRIRRTTVAGRGNQWGWFPVGANSITTTVSVTVTWRNQFA